MSYHRSCVAYLLSLAVAGPRVLNAMRHEKLECSVCVFRPEYQHHIEHVLPRDVVVHAVVLAGGSAPATNPLARNTNVAAIPIGAKSKRALYSIMWLHSEHLNSML